jgi:predicted N-acetyltransferase YhbS
LPSGHKLTEEEGASCSDLLVGVAGQAVADKIQAISEAFDEAHPIYPHFCLSPLATYPTTRGRGLGMDLVRDGLARIEKLGIPTYLGSSNQAVKDARYKSVGFEPTGTGDAVGASGCDYVAGGYDSIAPQVLEFKSRAPLHDFE